MKRAATYSGDDGCNLVAMVTGRASIVVLLGYMDLSLFSSSRRENKN